jgi:hypothetical protein
MLLGGNLPESLSHFLYLGHHRDGGETGMGDDVAQSNKDEAPEETIAIGSPHKQAATT